jgi:hypothetical protein
MAEPLKESMWKGVPVSELGVEELREALAFLLETRNAIISHNTSSAERRVVELERENAKLWKALGV